MELLGSTGVGFKKGVYRILIGLRPGLGFKQESGSNRAFWDWVCCARSHKHVMRVLNSVKASM